MPHHGQQGICYIYWSSFNIEFSFPSILWQLSSGYDLARSTLCSFSKQKAMGSTRDSYQICHPYEIKRTAVDLANKILARSDILEDVAHQIHITAVTQCDYTRSVALLVKAIFDYLNYRNRALAGTFLREVVALGTSTYVEFWLVGPRSYTVPRSSVYTT